MSNKKNNDAEKAIIQLGKIFKIFAVVAVLLIIALCIYLASNSNLGTKEDRLGISNLKKYSLAFSEHIEEDLRVFRLVRLF